MTPPRNSDGQRECLETFAFFTPFREFFGVPIRIAGFDHRGRGPIRPS